MDKNKKKGFTLVEVLLVTLLIGLILTIVALVLFDKEAKVRDAKRISDIKAIESAMQIIKNETGTFEKAFCELGPVNVCAKMSISDLNKYLTDLAVMTDPDAPNRPCSVDNCEEQSCNYSFIQLLPEQYQILFHLEKGTNEYRGKGCYLLSESGITKL